MFRIHRNLSLTFAINLLYQSRVDDLFKNFSKLMYAIVTIHDTKTNGAVRDGQPDRINVWVTKTVNTIAINGNIIGFMFCSAMAVNTALNPYRPFWMFVSR